METDWKRLFRFRCTCCGNCCREPIVLVTDEDIRRIAAHTGQKASEIVRFYEPDAIAWSTRKPGWIKLRAGRRIMALRRNRRGCRYLGEDDRCTIYEHRPITCRRYPFNVEMGGRGGIRMLSISDAVECPYELDGENSPAQIKALCDWEDAEEAPYFEKVRAWNRRRDIGGPAKFLTYLGF